MNDDGVTVYNKFVKAQLVRMAEYNPQSQPRIVWPAAFPVVRSYLDQLARGNGLPAARTTAIETRGSGRCPLPYTRWPRLRGNPRRHV